MRHSPVRMDPGAGHGTQPAPATLPVEAVAPLWLTTPRRASLLSRIVSQILLFFGIIALSIVWLFAGNPFEDGEDGGR
jgi:hypothetical protein